MNGFQNNHVFIKGDHLGARAKSALLQNVGISKHPLHVDAKELLKKTTEHPFHLVDPSPWPLFTSMAAFVFLLGNVMYMHS